MTTVDKDIDYLKLMREKAMNDLIDQYNKTRVIIPKPLRDDKDIEYPITYLVRDENAK